MKLKCTSTDTSLCLCARSMMQRKVAKNEQQPICKVKAYRKQLIIF
ncbi:hypothetical protein HanRHA438_Chr05g0241421 [Helianthus annuus]|uniref:Uncharacterized protein n=1 Tax=Helianthus annuus TaxID=4232 RepID=A0A9K3NPM9_HELAN|nr:hypothetical protein HanXRQr2_Chr05g0232131 [Helianthus annuus]KAJ0585816.1 hypothetical protein HanHA89_Chr05g0204961 [Helianthus annuus]KAJ0920448.1 hypothetical protein HanRHA438_Chr05g0241421 [Helianthus annuus]KAJ0924061.1 hypothetical protein HanPSC8_Chr05g0223881 [Helianthus annuus]